MNNSKSIKIEMDLSKDIVLVEDFDDDTRIMGPIFKAKDFLLDQIDGVLGFEVTEDEINDIASMGYDIKGICKTGEKLKDGYDQEFKCDKCPYSDVACVVVSNGCENIPEFCPFDGSQISWRLDKGTIGF